VLGQYSGGDHAAHLGPSPQQQIPNIRPIEGNIARKLAQVTGGPAG
jgi:hypothetical protein